MALNASFMVVDKARIASPEELASQGEAVALALPVEASLALHCSAPTLREVGVASLLASNGASMLAS